jgi:lysozyme
MTPSDACYALVRNAEGLRLASYQDSKGVWTIGFGHTHGVGPGMTCTADQAEAWLELDMGEAAAGVNLLATPCTQDQFDALTDFAFNEGVHALETSHLLQYHRAGDFPDAAHAFSSWVFCDGRILPGLVKRRAAEARLYLGEADT